MENPLLFGGSLLGVTVSTDWKARVEPFELDGPLTLCNSWGRDRPVRFSMETEHLQWHTTQTSRHRYCNILDYNGKHPVTPQDILQREQMLAFFFFSNPFHQPHFIYHLR